VLTGYRSGTAEVAAEGEPRPEFDPRVPLTTRYKAKAAELDVTMRTVQHWVSGFRSDGEAGFTQDSAGCWLHADAFSDAG
jgi:hypothetical protein